MKFLKCEPVSNFIYGIGGTIMLIGALGYLASIVAFLVLLGLKIIGYNQIQWFALDVYKFSVFLTPFYIFTFSTIVELAGIFIVWISEQVENVCQIIREKFNSNPDY